MDKILYLLTAVLTIFTAGYFRGRDNEKNKTNATGIKRVKETKKSRKKIKNIPDDKLNADYYGLLKDLDE